MYLQEAPSVENRLSIEGAFLCEESLSLLEKVADNAHLKTTKLLELCRSTNFQLSEKCRNAQIKMPEFCHSAIEKGCAIMLK